MFTNTDCGKIITKSAIKLDAYVPKGSMIAALLESNQEYIWCLFYEQGGDWTAFEDGEELNSEAIQDWMPSAIESAIEELTGLNFLDAESVEPDLEWFSNWATTAKSTLFIESYQELYAENCKKWVLVDDGAGNASYYLVINDDGSAPIIMPEHDADDEKWAHWLPSELSKADFIELIDNFDLQYRTH